MGKDKSDNNINQAAKENLPLQRLDVWILPERRRELLKTFKMSLHPSPIFFFLVVSFFPPFKSLYIY